MTTGAWDREESLSSLDTSSSQFAGQPVQSPSSSLTALEQKHSVQVNVEQENILLEKNNQMEDYFHVVY